MSRISIVRPWSPQEVNTKVWFPVKYCGTKRINTYSSIWFNHESFQYNQKKKVPASKKIRVKAPEFKNRKKECQKMSE